MSASPNDFVRIMEENRQLVRRNRELVQKNMELLAKLEQLQKTDKRKKS